jgi:hypothetical protein
MLKLSPAYDNLSPSEQVFVDEYVTMLAGQAYLNSQPLNKLLNQPVPQSHVEKSNGLLNRPLVRAAIAEKIDKVDLSARKIVNEYMAVAFSNMKNYVRIVENADGWVNDAEVSLSDLTDEQFAAIQEINVDYDKFTGQKKSIKLKLYPKLEALKMLTEAIDIAGALARETTPMLDNTTDPAEAYSRMIN